MSARHAEKSAAILICIAASIRTLTGIALGFHPFDDTFITFRYALNLATGHGFVYNWGDRVLGTTTPLWALALVPAAWFRLPLGDFALCASLILDLATAFVLYRLITRLGYAPIVGAAAAALFLLMVDYLALSLSGMESSLFVFLVVTTLFMVVARRWLLAGCLSALAVLTRPDGAALGVAILAAISLETGATAKLRRVGLASLGVLIVLAPWIVFATLYFGSPIPQSIFAKHHWAQGSDLRHFSNQNLMQFAIHGQYGGGLLSRSYWQGQFLLTLAAAIGAGALMKDALRGKKDAQLASCAMMIYPAVYVAAMGLAAAFTWYPWYYAPLYPFLAVLAVLGASRMGELLTWDGRPAATIAVAGVVAVLVTGQVIALVEAKLPGARKDFRAQRWRELAAHVPTNAGVTVAADEIGILGWTAYPVTVDDLVGLVSPSALNGSQESYLRIRRPDYIALHTDNSRALIGSIEKADWFSAEYIETAQAADRGYVLYRRAKNDGAHLREQAARQATMLGVRALIQ